MSNKSEAGPHAGARTSHRLRRLLCAGLLLGVVAVAVGAVGVVARRETHRRSAIAAVPAVDTSYVEPEAAEFITETRAIVLADPTSAHAWAQLARALLAHELTNEAAICFARAEQFDANEVRWPYLRGLCLAVHDPDEALACFRRAVELRGDLSHARLQLAEALLAAGSLDEASVHLERAADLAPGDPRVLLEQGRLAFLRGDLDAALRSTTEAARAAPRRHDVHLLLCQIHQRRDDHAAVREQMRVLRLLPETTHAYNRWPDPFVAEVTSYRRGVAATLGLATELFSAGRISEAIALLRRAGGADASDVRIAVLLGRALARTGDLIGAAETLNRAQERDPAFPEVHLELGNVALASARPDEAIAHYREAIRLQPNFAAAHHALGRCLRQWGDRDAAIAALTEACHHGADNFTAHRDLAELLLAAARQDEAIEHLQTAAWLAPNDSRTRTLLTRARAAPSNVSPK